MSGPDQRDDDLRDGPTDSDPTDHRRRLRRTFLRSVAGAFLMLVAYGWLSFDRTLSPTWTVIRAVAALAVLCGAIMWLAEAIRHSRHPTARAVETISLLIPLNTIVFAGLYLSLSSQDPAAFSERLDHIGALYLSMSVITTVGFGDVAASSQAARIIVMLHMVANVAVLVVGSRAILAAARGNDSDWTLLTGGSRDTSERDTRHDD